MKFDPFARYDKTLTHLASKQRRRELSFSQGIDFTSNDYLKFSHSPRLKNVLQTALHNGIAVGSGGSRLLRGNHEAFTELEKYAAHFFKSERALYFSNGYLANLCVFATLPKRGDVVLYDAFIHASILDGIKASHADAFAIAHNDLEQFEIRMRQYRASNKKGNLWLAVESLYSMDGDFAPLPALYNLAKQYDAQLIIDEAHGTGVFGKDGRGLTDFIEKQNNVIVLHTCGKALGVSGALLCLNEVYYHYLINHARAFIYSTAPSPLMAIAVLEALKMLREEPLHRTRLMHLYRFANEKFRLHTGRVGSGSQILPVIIGKNDATVRMAKRLQTEGYDIRAIRPPTVPEGTARLRLSITLHVTEEIIAEMMTTLFTLLREENGEH